jgi:SAM-dependent methyltransferase
MEEEIRVMFEEMYTRGAYLKKNPTWHVEESPWKAKNILRIMARNHIVPATICEVGCGAGEVLKLLQKNMNNKCMFWGYEISPQAFELCKTRANGGLCFELADIKQKKGAFFDIILVLDVVEHMEDYFSLLRDIKPKSRYKIFHIPLDLSVQTVLRSNPIIRGREQWGHIHYFTKEIALQMLKDVGYEVLDHFYTTELHGPTIKGHFLRLLRRLFFTIHEDLAVRILGGYRLMILAK